MTTPTRTMRRFTAQQKVVAVELCLQEGLSCNPVAEPPLLAQESQPRPSARFEACCFTSTQVRARRLASSWSWARSR